MKKSLICLLLLLSACQFSTKSLNNVSDKADAEKVVNEYYSFLARKQIDSALGLMHPYLLASNDPAKLREFLTGTSQQLPALKERKLDHWETKVVKGLEADSYYGLFYINKFDNSELKVSIALKQDTGNHIKIIGFQVDPQKFQKWN